MPTAPPELFAPDGTLVEAALPPELREWEALQRDPRWRAAEWLRCARDYAHWRRRWVWTFDISGGRNRIKRDPRYGYLESLTALHMKRVRGESPDRPHILTEKARRTLFSIWMAEMALAGLIFSDHAWQGFMMSYLFRRVDDGGKKSTPQSLIGKLRGIYNRLPAWQQELAPLDFKEGLVSNLLTGSSLTAEIGNDAGARGPGYDEGYIDEAGELKDLEFILGSVGPSTQFITLGGTPKGEHTYYAKLCADARKDEKDRVESAGFRFVGIDWWLIDERRRCTNCGSIEQRIGHTPNEEDPSGIVHRRDDCLPRHGLHFDARRRRLSSPWLEREAKGMTEQMVLQEFFRSHTRKRIGLVWPMFSTDQHVHEENALKLDGWDHCCGWDYGQGSVTSMCWTQRRGDRVEIFDDHETGPGHYAEHWCRYFAWMRGEFHAWKDKGEVQFDEDGHETPLLTWLPPKMAAEFRDSWGAPGRYRKIRHVLHRGDKSGKNLDSGGKSWELNLAQGSDWIGTDGVKRTVGRIHVTGFNERLSGIVTEQEKIQAVAYCLEHDMLGLHPEARAARGALGGLVWPSDRSGNPITNKEPKHDQFSHSADTIAYILLYFFGRIGTEPIAVGRRWSR